MQIPPLLLMFLFHGTYSFLCAFWQSFSTKVGKIAKYLSGDKGMWGMGLQVVVRKMSKSGSLVGQGLQTRFFDIS